MKKTILMISMLAAIMLVFCSCKNDLSQDNQKDTTPPAKVQNTSITAGDKAVLISWTNPNDDDFTNVQISFTPKVEGVTQPLIIQGEPNKTSSTTINGLQNGTEYVFTIIALDSSQNKSEVVTIKATPKDIIPTSEVSDFSVKEGIGEMTLKWTNPADLDFYAVEITITDQKNGKSQTELVTGNASETKSYLVSNLTIGEEYSFTIVTIDSDGNKSQGISKTATQRGISVSLPNDNDETKILTKDKAPIKMDVWGFDSISKVVWKKRDGDNIPTLEALLTDEDASSLTIDSNTATVEVSENGIYDIVIQNGKEINEITQVEVKTIDKIPLAEVENLETSFDGENIVVTWKDPVSNNEYDSPLKSIIIQYVYNDDETDSDNGEMTIGAGKETVSIKVADTKSEYDFMQINIQTVDELGNISQGKKIQKWCNNYTNFIITDAANASTTIKNMTESGRVAVIGKCDTLADIKYALKSTKIKIELDLTKTTGITNSFSFRDLTSLASISIPDSVTNIEGAAFKGCSNLISVFIPDSVTDIGSQAFEDCSNLTSVSIPNSVKNIDKCAFLNCKNLTNINIPDAVTIINEGVFSGCKNLSSIIIPNSVTKICDRAFSGCSMLKDISIPNSVTSIGSSAFYNCYSLNNLSIPDSVIDFGINAFSGCAVKLSIGEYVVNNFNSIFSNKSGILSIEIRSDVTSIGDSTFSGCSHVKSITIPDSVTSIGNSAFSGCSELASITIPDSVTSIGDYAFYDCVNLSTVILSNSITKIGDYTFYNCHILNPIVIPKSITSIGEYAFYNNQCCTNVIIPDNVTEIGDSAFAFCSSITDITIPNSVTRIGNSAFYGCSHIISITIPDSVTNIGSYAFHRCIRLTDIILSKGVTRINEGTFYECQQLRNIDIPDTLTSIGDSAFNGCQYLSNITIPNSVTSIGDYAFTGCSNITSVTIPDSVTSIGKSAFYRCLKLNDITISNGVTRIEESTFYECQKLKKVIIPDNVVSIGDSAFYSCSALTTITMGKEVIRIGKAAFYKCTKLSSIEFRNTKGFWYETSNSDYTGGQQFGNMKSRPELIRFTSDTYYYKK